MRVLCALVALCVVLALDACAKPCGFDVRVGVAPRWWQDGGAGPDNINREPIRR